MRFDAKERLQYHNKPRYKKRWWEMIRINFHDEEREFSVVDNKSFYRSPLWGNLDANQQSFDPSASNIFSDRKGTVSHNNDSWIFSEASTLLWMVKTISFYDQLSSYLLCFMKQISSFIECSWKEAKNFIVNVKSLRTLQESSWQQQPNCSSDNGESSRHPDLNIWTDVKSFTDSLQLKTFEWIEP